MKGFVIQHNSLPRLVSGTWSPFFICPFWKRLLVSHGNGVLWGCHRKHETCTTQFKGKFEIWIFFFFFWWSCCQLLACESKIKRTYQATFLGGEGRGGIRLIKSGNSAWLFILREMLHSLQGVYSSLRLLRMSQADGLAKAASGLRLFACMLDGPGLSPTAGERDAVREQGCGWGPEQCTSYGHVCWDRRSWRTWRGKPWVCFHCLNSSLHP